MIHGIGSRAIPENPYDWYAKQRGISKETLDAFGVTVDDEGTIHYPYRNGEKRRPNPCRPLKDGERRFYFDKGLVPCLFCGPIVPGDTAFLVEGESDTLRLWQELNGSTPVYGRSGVNTWSK